MKLQYYHRRQGYRIGKVPSLETSRNRSKTLLHLLLTMGETRVCVCVCTCVRVHAPSLSHVWLFATHWTVTHQTPLSVGLSRQEYWSGWPCPPPGDLPDPGIEPVSLLSSALAGGLFTTAPPGKPHKYCTSDKSSWELYSALFINLLQTNLSNI